MQCMLSGGDAQACVGWCRSVAAPARTHTPCQPGPISDSWPLCCWCPLAPALLQDVKVVKKQKVAAGQPKKAKAVVEGECWLREKAEAGSTGPGPACL
jgi:hypothetical protein